MQNSCLLRTSEGLVGFTLLLSMYLSFSVALNSDNRTPFTDKSVALGEGLLMRGGLGDLGESVKLSLVVEIELTESAEDRRTGMDCVVIVKAWSSELSWMLSLCSLLTVALEVRSLVSQGSLFTVTTVTSRPPEMGSSEYPLSSEMVSCSETFIFPRLSSRSPVVPASDDRE